MNFETIRQAIPASQNPTHGGASKSAGFKAAQEGLGRGHCTHKVGTRQRTEWLSGWHLYHSQEANSEAADGRGTTEHSDPKKSMRECTESPRLAR